MERTSTAADATLSTLPALEPVMQANLLARLAQEARLVRLALSASHADADRMASCFERALGGVMDAEADDESAQAHRELASVLTDVRNAGLSVSATLDEMTLDGILGMQRLPVLTAVLSAKS
jgi:hypothetical protein